MASKTLAGKKRGRVMGAPRITNVLCMAAKFLVRSSSAFGAALRRKARHTGMNVVRNLRDGTQARDLGLPPAHVRTGLR
ncbi:MAG: hypothetical protein OXN89_05975 [Bryobacterales bacterium]|nr:hypothetical protein [Bryobacterales bacterium]